MNQLLQYLDISDDVLEAIDKDIPVIGLETAILSNGLSYPDNYHMAMEVVRIIQEAGCVPATLAVLNGRIKVGLSEDQIKFMCQSSGIIQMTRKDLPFVVAKQIHGSTTVATSIIISRMVGIKLLVTAGIGGVHRGGQDTFDVSRDLQELANNDIALVCSGPKSILDVGLTLEYLETFGVPVLGYQTDRMPAFGQRDSGFYLDYRIDEAKEIGKVVKTKWDIGLEGGVLICNPIGPHLELDTESLEQALQETIEESKRKHLEIKQATPLLLDRVLELTEGKSLLTIIEMLKSNARLGAQIAKELYRIDY